MPIQEIQVGALGQEDTLKKETATIAVSLPEQSHGQRNLVGYGPWGHKRIGHDLVTKKQHVPLTVLSGDELGHGS